MMGKRSLFIWVVLVVWQCLINHQIYAGTTGKIRGRTIDTRTKEFLPGVNIFINKIWIDNQEMDYHIGLGAASNNEGEFIILKVPPGIYSITANIIGYAPVTRQHVQVYVDRTTILDFDLQEQVLEGEAVIVEAEQDVIQLDVSATESYVTDKQYQDTPFANRMEDVIGLQSGVGGNLLEGEIKIREGETREVGFLIDGMGMTDKKFNRPVFSVQPGMIQEIKIMRNGFNAEYGQSRSGIINVVTKNPTDQFRFTLDYQLSPAQKPHYGRNKYDKNWRPEWRLLDGPKKFQGDTLYIPDGLSDKEYIWQGWDKYSETLLNDNNPDNDLTAEETYELWKWRHRPLNYGNLKGHNLDLSLSGPVRGLPWKSNFLIGGKYENHPFDYPQSLDNYSEHVASIKIVNELSSGMRLIVNGMYSNVKSVAKGDLNSEWREEALISYDGENFPDYYSFYLPIINRKTTLIGAKLIHTLSPTLFYEINLNHFFVDWGIKRADTAPEDQGRYFHDRLYYDPQSGWIPKELGVDDVPPFDFRMYGTTLLWDDSWNRRLVLTAALTNQFHPSHELKYGFTLNYDILRENRLLWKNEDPSQEYIRDWKVTPIEFGMYIQDKIEFQGMIANVGIRFDYYSPNSDLLDIRYSEELGNYEPLTYPSDKTIFEAVRDGTYPTYRPKPRMYVSPRVGLSHPLSENSKIYFNYGHFVQTPPTRDVYTRVLDGAKPGIQMMGNPELPFEKTIAYELGCDIGLSRTIQFHVGAFYKNNSDVASRMTYAHTDQSLIMDYFGSNNYSEIRGIEIEFRKSIGRFLTGWFNYNYIKKSQSNLSIPNLSDNPIVTDDPNVGINGVVWGVPLSDIRRVEPNGRGVITFSAPQKWGPKLLDYPVLANTTLNLQVFYRGGAQKQHPRQSFRDAYPNVWFKELSRYWANMRLSRRFRIDWVDFELYLDVSNIFHTKFRNPPEGRSGEDYYDDLWESGRINKVGTDKLTNPDILRTENDDVWWGKVKTIMLGLRLNI
jgi:hypothetical protein